MGKAYVSVLLLVLRARASRPFAFAPRGVRAIRLRLTLVTGCQTQRSRGIGGLEMTTDSIPIWGFASSRVDCKSFEAWVMSTHR